MRMKTPAVALATAALMTLAACGGGGSGGGGTPGSDETVGAGTGKGGEAGSFKNPDAEAPLAMPDGATQGGTLTVLTANVPSTLDPTQAYYTDSTAILSDLVTRGLTQYAYNEDTQDMQLIPDMATDLGRPNEDNTEWTFTLRDGLKYSDGSDVKAEDIAYAVKRSFAIAELPDGPTYQTTFFLDGDKYKGPFKKNAGDYAGVEVDGQDITIKMRRPFTDMDYYGSFPAFTAIPEAKDNPQTYGQSPLATGPYKFEDYKAGSTLKLVKNDQWDPNTDPGRIQAVDGWDFRFGQDTAKLENVIINDNGSAQTTLTYDNVSASSYRQISQDKERLVTGTSPCTYMWFIDMTKIKDLKVRQALGWAFPYQAYWKGGGEVEGVTRVPGTAILPPGTAGRVDYEALEGQDGKTTDPDKARALLEEADAVGFEIKFLFSTDITESVESKDQTVKGLEAAGFKAKPIATTSATSRTDRTVYDSPQNVRSSGWCSDWPTGGSWFPAQWAGDLVGLEGMPNPANFDVKKFNQEQDRILDELGPEEAAQAWGEFDKMMETEEYPAINLGYSGTAMIHGSKVGGMENDNVRGMPTFARMYITE